jgi:benzodiazapine receptor
MKLNFSKLLPSLTLPLVVGLSSGYLTYHSIESWYQTLTSPPLTPPNWVFGPVWTMLYLTIGLSLYIFWESKAKETLKNHSYTIFILQLVANFCWSFLFFGLHSPLLALIDILLLLALIVANIYYFYQGSRYSAYLLIPYLLWVAFATYLNIGFLILN